MADPIGMLVIFAVIFGINKLVLKRKAYIGWAAMTVFFLIIGWVTEGEWLGGPFEEVGFYHAFWLFVFIVPTIVMSRNAKAQDTGVKKESIMESIKKVRPVKAPEPAQKKSPKYCPNCGAELRDGLKFCTKCGEKL